MRIFIYILFFLCMKCYSFAEIITLNSLEEHQQVLKKAFVTAKNRVIISSPQISIEALNADNIILLIKDAVQRSVKVIIYTDSKLDLNERTRTLKSNTEQAHKALKESKSKLKIVDQLHAKVLIIDNTEITSGSFNWLGATRNEKSPYRRYEHSFNLTGNSIKNHIHEARLDLKSLELQTCYRQILAGNIVFAENKILMEGKSYPNAPINICAPAYILAEIVIKSFCKRNCFGSEQYEALRDSSYLLRNLMNFIFTLKENDKDAFFSLISVVIGGTDSTSIALSNIFTEQGNLNQFALYLLEERIKNEQSLNPALFPAIKGIKKVNVASVLKKQV